MLKLVSTTLDCIRTGVFYYTNAILGLIMSITGPTLLDLEHSSRTDAYGISFIFTARSSGYLIGSLAGGVVLDWLKREEIALVFSTLFVALGAYVIPWCRSLPFTLVIFFLIGFAVGFSNTGCNASCLRIWGKKGAPILQGLHLMYGCGSLLAPLIAAHFLEEFLPLASEQINITLTSNTTSEFSNISSILNQIVETKEINESIPSITFAYTIVGVLATVVPCCFAFIFLFTEPERTVEKEETVEVRDPGFSFTAIVVFLACLHAGVSAGIEISFSQMVFSYVVGSPHNLSKSKGSYLTSVYWLSFTATRIFSIFLACKLHIRKILCGSIVLCVIACTELLAIGSWSVTGVWVGAALLGIAMAPLFPGTLSWVERYININNRIASSFTLVMCLLEMTVPLTISIYLNSFPNVLFCFLIGGALTECILFIILNVVLTRKGEKYVPCSGKIDEKHKPAII